MKLSFIALGVAVLWIAVGSPLAHLDHHLLTAHMVQHLLLMLVSAPLILLGVPSFVSQWRPHPAFCWLAGILTVIVWHVPAVFDLALRSPAWHDFEQVSFFTAGSLFWWPVIQTSLNTANSPRWSIPIYLFLATLPCDALSAFLAFRGHVVYRHYVSVGSHHLLTPLEDQSLAGALMWVTVTFAYLVPALIVTAKLLSGERTRIPDLGAW